MATPNVVCTNSLYYLICIVSPFLPYLISMYMYFSICIAIPGTVPHFHILLHMHGYTLVMFSVSVYYSLYVAGPHKFMAVLNVLSTFSSNYLIGLATPYLPISFLILLNICTTILSTPPFNFQSSSMTKYMHGFTRYFPPFSYTTSSLIYA